MFQWNLPSPPSKSSIVVPTAGLAFQAPTRLPWAAVAGCRGGLCRARRRGGVRRATGGAAGKLGDQLCRKRIVRLELDNFFQLFDGGGGVALREVMVGQYEPRRGGLRLCGAIIFQARTCSV